MLKENLMMLRKLHGFSQEEIADRIGISRQAYAKWENGSSVPDIERCALLAQVYGTTLDGLVKTETVDGVGMIPPAPKGKNIWGSVTVSERGQIVIPKGAREQYSLTGGRRLIVVGDEAGVALIPAQLFEEKLKQAMDLIHHQNTAD